ncbi:MAG: RNA polymerase sigma factor [Acidimicrobiales bacterium]
MTRRECDAPDSAIDRARAGASSGFDDLHHEFVRPILAFVRSRNVEDPDALTNEVFLRAFRQLHTFEGGADDFGRWVFTIARNIVIDAHRAAARRPARSDAPIDPDLVSVPSAEAVGIERLDPRMNRLLSHLTDAQREVVVLRIVADLSLADVATIVGRPVTAVKRLQSRALRKLQKEILDEEVS